MKAVIYEAFGVTPQLKNVPDPTPETHGVIVKVMATGVCRSDWHGWVGQDADAGAGGNPATPHKVSCCSRLRLERIRTMPKTNWSF